MRPSGTTCPSLPPLLLSSPGPFHALPCPLPPTPKCSSLWQLPVASCKNGFPLKCEPSQKRIRGQTERQRKDELRKLLSSLEASVHVSFDEGGRDVGANTVAVQASWQLDPQSGPNSPPNRSQTHPNAQHGFKYVQGEPAAWPPHNRVHG